MIPVVEALKTILADLQPVAVEEIPVISGLGRVLAEDVSANLTYPPSDISAMDGYAVKAADTSPSPASFQQIGVSQAGSGFGGTISNGETVRIFTGAPIPDGADAVVIQENTETDGTIINVRESVSAGSFVRSAGLDFSTGEIMRRAGDRLTARDLGMLAAANIAVLPVYRKPRVAYLATGDELVMPGGDLGPDQIISSNSIAMDAYIRAFGGEPVSLGIARDTADSLRDALSGMKDIDLLVTMGGASVGDFDLVQSVMGDEGLELGFYKVAMRPGKPLIFGNFKGVPMLGLPGNPVSASVTALLFMGPAINRLSGGTGETAVRRARLGRDLPANDRRQDYLRATLTHDETGALVATPFERQDSSMMKRLADSECLVVRPPHADAAENGAEVEIVSFGDGFDVF